MFVGRNCQSQYNTRCVYKTRGYITIHIFMIHSFTDLDKPNNYEKCAYDGHISTNIDVFLYYHHVNRMLLPIRPQRSVSTKPVFVRTSNGRMMYVRKIGLVDTVFF